MTLTARLTIATCFAATVAVGAVEMTGVVTIAQTPGAAEAHIAAARNAAGTEHKGVFDTVCNATIRGEAPARGAAPAAAAASGTSTAGATGAAAAAPRRQGPPDRSTWHADPVKVFDNLYWVGQTEYSAWAVTTSAGIIVIDTIFDYSVEDEVVNGLKTLGLDPTQIKYAIVSHGHGDHSGGAKYLQDHFGTKIILSAEDWDLLDRSAGTKPKRDIVATDGMKLTLGDTTLTLYVTPGHTLGTISTLIPVKDHGEPHMVAEWGGTAFNWMTNRNAYITPERPDRFWFETYSKSAERFRDIAAKANADVVIANHTNFDGTKTKAPALKARKPGEKNPYVIGKEGVLRYMTVVDECAQAGLARATMAAK
jgi:metallo-beta-lactamase class B